MGDGVGLLVSLALAILAVVLAGPALAQSKVALVVGVSDYKVGGKLPQTLADAEKVAGSLASVGFSVERLAVPALSKGALEDALLAFGERAARADVAVLYFAGHGMQHGDDNWLIPASANLRSEEAIRFEGGALQDIMELMKKARFRIIILDACRNNPFRVNWPQTMSGPDGLGAVPKAALPVGSLVAFSAAPGQKVPNDGVYADALSRLIREGQGLELNQLMRRVRSEVQRKTPAAAPEYIPNYEGSFSFSGGYDPDAGVKADVAQRDAQIAELQRQLAELKASAAATPAGPAREAKLDLAAAISAGLEAYERQDYPGARRNWQAACDGGNALGCFNLGTLYERGQGVTQDFGQARTLYQKGCDGGNANGCFNLGLLYENGLGVTLDYGQARTLYQKGCDGGSAKGCSYQGDLVYRGLGGMKDIAAGRALLEKGCRAGDAWGCDRLKKLDAAN